MSVEAIARLVRASVRTVLVDLQHVRRGLRSSGVTERWVQHDAECLACGFRFRGRTRLNTPSRCPDCRGEEIRDPEFEIVSSESKDFERVKRSPKRLCGESEES